MVNITMLVRNRRRLTQQAIDSLRSSITPESRHVTILDDASEPYYMDESAIRNTVSKGTGAARNQVIRESELRHGRGDYLYLSDNDVYFYPTWLPILIKCYEKAYDFGYRAIGAYNHPYHQPGASVPVYGAYEVREVNALALQSMLMSWETWDKYGPFCQTPPGKVCQSEDVDFTNKLKADGYKLGVVSPALVVNTGITNSFGQKIPGYELVKQQCPPGVICE